jgi:hypothetical protein
MARSFAGLSPNTEEAWVAMKILDFYRSFTVFEVDFEKRPPRTVSDRRQNSHNRARIRIDCRCSITTPDGVRHDFYLGESNKSERVGASRELGVFTQPNADYRPIHSSRYSLILKSWDRNDKGVMLDPPSLGPQPERNLVRTSEAYYTHRFHLTYTDGTELKSAAEIIASADDGDSMVAICQYEDSGHTVEMEISHRDHQCQREAPELSDRHGTSDLSRFFSTICESRRGAVARLQFLQFAGLD